MNLVYDILIVDDVRENIQVAMNILREDNYIFSYATSGKQALDIIKTKKFDLILLDIMMPNLSGFEVIKILKKDESTKNIPIIFLTAKSDVDSLAQGFELGAVDYIKKPFHPAELLSRVANHLELYRSRETLIQHNINLSVKIEKSVERFSTELEETQKEIISLLTKLMGSTSDETSRHLIRVAKYSKLLATLHHGISEDEANTISDASVLHDIGKITIPDHILHKKGSLSENEYNIMKTHTTSAYEVFSDCQRNLSKAICIIAHQHHEKWNGLGYPQGLKGENIHIYGRIVALADVLDALTHKRVYKKAWSFEDASKYIVDLSGVQFDPYLIELFTNNTDKFKRILESIK